MLRGSSLALLLLACGASDEPGVPRLALDSKVGVVEVHGLSSGERSRLRRVGDERWPELLAVYTAAAIPGDPPVLGTYSVEGESVRFTPRFAFVPGQAYVAVWRGSSREVRIGFALPRAPAPKPTSVTQIYPSADELPENLLRVYIHFSGPMRRGAARAHLHLLSDEGEQVAAPFVTLEPELWNRETTRLTVLLDPGRIKRGVGPNLEAGPPLRAGRSYRLVVQAGWLDASGQPLAAPYEKRFRAVAAERERLRAERWRLAPPAHGDDALELHFPEPLDHALLHRMLTVLDAVGSRVQGSIVVDQGETRWRFTPDAPWTPGGYQIRADTALEDVAGNSLRRAFETSLQAGSSGKAPGEIRLPFLVEARGAL